MNLKQYLDGCTSKERLELAEKLNTSRPYLYQLAVGHRKAGAKFLLTIEDATGGKVTPKELRDGIAA